MLEDHGSIEPSVSRLNFLLNPPVVLNFVPQRSSQGFALVSSADEAVIHYSVDPYCGQRGAHDCVSSLHCKTGLTSGPEPLKP